MAEHRALVLINGDLQQMPVGDLLSNHKVLVVNSGEIYQSNGTDYPVIKPLVMINNEISQLPDGDTLAGAGPTIDYTVDFAKSYVIIGTLSDSVKLEVSKPYIVSGSSITSVSLLTLRPLLVHGSFNQGTGLISYPIRIVHGTGNGSHLTLGYSKPFVIWKPTS